MSGPWKEPRRYVGAGGCLIRHDTALQIASNMQPYGLDFLTWRSRRGALEAISYLRDDWFLNTPGHVDYWLARLRHYRRVHSQVVAVHAAINKAEGEA